MVGNLSILVVDDSNGMRVTMSAILRTVGHFPVAAANGREAMEILRRQPVDAILTDILMPEKDGLEFIEEVRAELPSVPIVAFSGGGHMVGEDYCLSTAKSFGATVTLMKPFDKHQLLAAIGEAVEQGKPRRARKSAD